MYVTLIKTKYQYATCFETIVMILVPQNLPTQTSAPYFNMSAM